MRVEKLRARSREAKLWDQVSVTPFTSGENSATFLKFSVPQFSQL